ncbi:hypothetical protein ABIA32_005650 [Streptacidiphilus sp. MAP12-20]|uniref:peptidoglycan-binding domain-containing protein n=1 Tax=Streptacidiphilus sp. MAP12-20 TaxID=3156299 RepID=UPI003519253E
MESQSDLVRPYVAQMGESAPESVAPPVAWTENLPDPAPQGRSGHRPGHRQRRIRPGVMALALLISAAAAAILASTLDGSGANGASPLPAAVLPSLSQSAAQPSSSTAPTSPAQRPASPASPSGTNGVSGANGASGPNASGKPSSGGATPQAASSHGAATGGGSSSGGSLRPGDRGPAVARMQQLLFDQGFTYVSVTGVYDDATTRGVTQFQSDRGLSADPPGVYGPQSRASLDPGS